jgi:hypothetical protein
VDQAALRVLLETLAVRLRAAQQLYLLGAVETPVEQPEIRAVGQEQHRGRL